MDKKALRFRATGLIAGLLTALILSHSPVRAQTDHSAGEIEPIADGTAPLPDREGTLIAQSATVSWQRELSSSLRLATSSRKWVIVDVYTDWCGWCKKMDRDTFADPQVVQMLNKSFICVKANAEDGGSGQAVANKYGVQSFPCILILEPSGKLKSKLRGYRPPESFYASIVAAFKQ